MSSKQMKNWKITAWLATPLAGENAPMLDALLAWELAQRLGSKHHRKTTRATPIDEIPDVPIPLAKRTFSGVDVYCVSNPIMPNPLAEWTEYLNKRIDTMTIAPLLSPNEQKSLLIASGPFKMRHSPIRVRLVDRVVWFARGGRVEINKLLKSIYAIGAYRGAGYGRIARWEFEDMGDNNFSIFACWQGKPVLMRTIPLGEGIENVCGYRPFYGGFKPPYWHPALFRDVAVPC